MKAWRFTDDCGINVIREVEPDGSLGDYIASTWGGKHEERARLLSAAPELLEMLLLIKEAATDRRGDDFNLTAEQWARVHAVVFKATNAAPAAAPSRSVEHRLWDSQWVNVVNAPEVMGASDTEAAVFAAVRLTERGMAKNVAENEWPPTRSAR